MNSEWWKNAVIYQIYPKSFKDSNGDGFGDINGIIEKLPYIKSLGVDAIWLNPLYVSPQVDNGYDIADYRKVDPRFGSNEDLYHLIREAHQLNLKIIMDLVVNGTSDQHQWFKESCKSKDNYFSDFYIWKDAKEDGSEPNNWGSNFSGSAWEWNEQRQQYYLHYYAKEQPDLNWENPRVREAVYDLMRFWKARGVDGWRMDIITSISKNQDFPDNPAKNGEKYVVANQDNGPRMHEFIHDIDREVLSPFKMMSVGEAPASKSIDARQLVDPKREELDMVFTFEHMHIDRKPGGVNGRWDVQPADIIALKNILSDWQNSLRDHGWNALYFENHDRARTPSRWGNDHEYRYESATAFATVLHCLQGTPFVYQGEEIGMTNPDFKLEDYEDVELTTNYHQFVEEQKTLSAADFLKAAHKISRDNARTPMQWNDSVNAGFSEAKPWFKINARYPEINVAKDQESQKSVSNYYRKLIELRHQNLILRDGTYELKFADDPDVFVYERVLGKQKWTVIANLSEKTFDLSDYYTADAKTKVLLSNYQRQGSGLGNAALKPWEALVCENQI
ncbi:glycoside hydrolase family 13 protein [Ligilactobacillus acidipiscis]|uniref:glycoside hydrolase family 13 protein n=1 Tax=Ligilactobacillus acidipiscis TaxID=89059 RepID=UPI0023F99FFD|nr:alpha-glucosidase [Ligilactobacillus acidipiscis]WEV57337.1 alpha-glucosidase [Ligilactobacillus acidipiscis]